jgi:hypothetical protein
MTRLMNDPTLSARLLTLMPTGSTKMDLMNAANGFRNLGQFIAALHAAKDLNIPFGFGTTAAPGTLKAEMTGSDHDSLGQAIHELNSKLNAEQVKDEVTNAQTAAKADLKADRAAKEAAEDAKDKTEDANEKAAEKHEDAKEKAEEANEGVKAGANFAARLAARLKNDPTLANTLNGLLPPGITSVTDAATGFRNLNQFLAALHAAKDLNIPGQSAMQTFVQLKAEMAGSDHDSLGQAIRDLNTGLTAQQVKDEVTKARNEAKADLQMVRAAEDKAEDANEAAQEAAEDAKEATKEAAEQANEAAKAPTGSSATGTSTTKP